MAAYAFKLKKEIARWSAEGLIDVETADRLVRDIDSGAGSRFSFARVFSMMAAVLLGAAVLIFVAANWEAMPRMVRVALLIAIIAGGYVGGATLKTRGSSAFAEAAWVVAATAFGASIALIAQMYHMSSDEKTAILTWAGGAGLAALLLRSPALSVGTAILSGVWMTLQGFEAYRFADLPHGWLAMALLLWGISCWTRSAATRQLVALLLVVYAFLAFAVEESALVPVLLMVLATGMFATARLLPSRAQLLGLGSSIYLHGLIQFLAAAVMLHVLLTDSRAYLLAVVLTFAGIVAALFVAGRDHAPLRWLAYAAFIAELCYVYVEMLGTMLGTAGFFLFSGFVLAGLAWVLMRVERRMATPGIAEEVP